MPINREPLKVIKVPLNYKPDFKAIRFPPMPRLYLELLENKQKVKPELRNSEYIPKIQDNLPSTQSAANIVDKEDNDDFAEFGSNDYPVKDSKNQDYNKPRTLDLSSDKKYDSPKKDDSLFDKIREDKPKEENDLLSILKTGSAEKAIPTTSGVAAGNQSISSVSQPISTTVQQSVPNLPPSLQEIGEGKVPTGNYLEVNVTRNEENDLVRKREILHKFKYLRKYYPDVQIPDYNEYTDLSTLEAEYNSLVKTLKIDSNVENYKKYLQMGFFGLEFFLSNILKFEEIKGFTTAQMLNMNQYERILVEIGEKSYIPEDKQIAPELRLLGIILMNAAVFIGTKMVMKKFDGFGGGNRSQPPPNFQQQFNQQQFNQQQFNQQQFNQQQFNQQQFNQQQFNQQPSSNKKKMKGPDLTDFDGLGDMINKKNN